MWGENQRYKNELLQITDDIYCHYYNFIGAIKPLWIQY
jgi:hypothetical protein